MLLPYSELGPQALFVLSARPLHRKCQLIQYPVYRVRACLNY